MIIYVFVAINSNSADVVDCTCTICQEQIDIDNPIQIAQPAGCNDLFHLSCINEWTSSDLRRDFCPNCRREITQLKVVGIDRPIDNPSVAVIAANQAMREAENYSLLTEGERGEALWQAACNRNYNLVNILLMSGPISAHCRGASMLIAYQDGNFELANALLQGGPILEADRGLAVLAGVQRGDREWVRRLGFVPEAIESESNLAPPVVPVAAEAENVNEVASPIIEEIDNPALHLFNPDPLVEEVFGSSPFEAENVSEVAYPLIEDPDPLVEDEVFGSSQSEAENSENGQTQNPVSSLAARRRFHMANVNTRDSIQEQTLFISNLTPNTPDSDEDQRHPNPVRFPIELEEQLRAAVEDRSNRAQGIQHVRNHPTENENQNLVPIRRGVRITSVAARNRNRTRARNPVLNEDRGQVQNVQVPTSRGMQRFIPFAAIVAGLFFVLFCQHIHRYFSNGAN